MVAGGWWLVADAFAMGRKDLDLDWVAE